MGPKSATFGAVSMSTELGRISPGLRRGAISLHQRCKRERKSLEFAIRGDVGRYHIQVCTSRYPFTQSSYTFREVRPHRARSWPEQDFSLRTNIGRSRQALERHWSILVDIWPTWAACCGGARLRDSEQMRPTDCACGTGPPRIAKPGCAAKQNACESRHLFSVCVGLLIVLTVYLGCLLRRSLTS